MCGIVFDPYFVKSQGDAPGIFAQGTRDDESNREEDEDEEWYLNNSDSTLAIREFEDHQNSGYYGLDEYSNLDLENLSFEVGADITKLRTVALRYSSIKVCRSYSSCSVLTCSICLEAIPQSEPVLALPCTHLFHTVCLTN